MTKFLYIIGLLLLTAMSIKAQQTQKMSAYILRGSITNGDDATAVVGATVRLFQQNKGSVLKPSCKPILLSA